MNYNQSILRIIVALAIVFGLQTTTNAQLGGMMKKAKKALQEKVSEATGGIINISESENESETGNVNNDTNANTTLKAMEERSKAEEKAGLASGGITLKNVEYGYMLATYYPNERKWLRGDGLNFTVAEDGTASWSDGRQAGKINADGFSTVGLPKIDYDQSADAFYLKGKLISTVRDEGNNTILTFLGKEWMITSSPIEHKLAGFLTIGMSFNEELIEEQIQNNADQAEAKASVDRLTNPKRPDGRLSDVRDLEWLNSNETGVPQEDDQWLFTSGSLRFNSGYVASYEDNIHDYFYNQIDGKVDPIIMGKYVNGGMYNRFGKWLGMVDDDWNVINADGKKVGYVKNGRMYLADGKMVGFCTGSHTRFIADYVFFIFLKQ